MSNKGSGRTEIRPIKWKHRRPLEIILPMLLETSKSPADEDGRPFPLLEIDKSAEKIFKNKNGVSYMAARASVVLAAVHAEYNEMQYILKKGYAPGGDLSGIENRARHFLAALSRGSKEYQILGPVETVLKGTADVIEPMREERKTLDDENIPKLAPNQNLWDMCFYSMLARFYNTQTGKSPSPGNGPFKLYVLAALETLGIILDDDQEETLTSTLRGVLDKLKKEKYWDRPDQFHLKIESPNFQFELKFERFLPAP